MLWSTAGDCDVTGYDVISGHVMYDDDVIEDEVDAATVDDDYDHLVLSSPVRR